VFRFRTSLKNLIQHIKPYFQLEEEEGMDQDICPLLGEPCLKKDCNWWNKKNKKCLIPHSALPLLIFLFNSTETFLGSKTV